MLARNAVLLVIDNFEQVLDAAPELSRLLAASPQTKLVVTSRAALRIQRRARAGDAAAGRRARRRAVPCGAPARSTRGCGSAPGDEQRIEQICARLDGLPLAIELAAARMKVLKPAAILERLGRRLDLLSSGSRDAPARQQTLRAAIGWSYDLLDPDTQAVFERLGVFAGGFTLEAAEAVCGFEALDAIASLVEHSLLTSRDGRFELLETVREYALDRLTKAGHARRGPPRAHARLPELVEGGENGHGERADRRVARPARRRARERARRDAPSRSPTARPTSRSLFCADLWRYWIWRGNLTEGRELLAAALALGGGPPALRQRALNGAGAVAGEQGDFERGEGALRAEPSRSRRGRRRLPRRAHQRQPRQPRALRARLRRGDRALRRRRRRSCARSATRAGSA